MTTKPSRHVMIETTCQWCGDKFMARRQRVEKGQSRFCSREHYQEWLEAQGSQRKNIGKENAIIQWDNATGLYRVYWYDENMKYKSTSWARWAWELNFGEIPNGYRVSYIDGNPKNNVLENLKLKSWQEYGDDLGERVRGVPKSEESRKKMSKSHAGKILSEDHKKHIADANREKWAKGVYDTVHIGENHVRWRGGIKYLIYPKEYYAIRRWIIERDNETCQVCGKDASRKGQVHHIDGNKNHNTEENLILLCSGCHNRIHAVKSDIASIMAFRAKLEWNQNDQN